MYTGEIHPTTLYIYDEYMVYVKRGFIRRNEATISYNHVSQVYFRKGYIASSIEVINTGGVENINIPWVNTQDAQKAKKIIDQKVFHTHARVSGKEKSLGIGSPDFERRLARLRELVARGEMSKKEFEKRREEMLKSV
jgi:hypothetical protein